MGKDGKLIEKANRDFELAKGYSSRGDVEVATLLYNKAVERVLRALYMRRRGRTPPRGATISYIARNAKIPVEVSDYIGSVLEPDGREMEEGIIDGYDELPRRSVRAQSHLYLEGLTKRLLDCARFSR